MMKTVVKGTRAAFLVFLGLFPGRVRSYFLRLCLGYDVHHTARIGISYLDCESLVLRAHSRIGHFTAVRNAQLLALEEYAGVGNFNWIAGEAGRSGNALQTGSHKPDTLTIGRHSYITHRHMIDIAGGIEIGSHSVVSGYRSQFLTHSRNFSTNRQELSGIRIGHHAFVGTACVLLKGAKVPDCCIVGASSLVLESSGLKSYDVAAGSPVKPIRQAKPDLPYFTRSVGRAE